MGSGVLSAMAWFRQSWCTLTNVDAKRTSTWLCLTLAAFVSTGTSFGQCKGTPVLKVSYEGVGMDQREAPLPFGLRVGSD